MAIKTSVNLRTLQNVSLNFFNWVTMKKAWHNRALKDLLSLLKSIEDFFARYRLQEDTSFKTVFANMGQIRMDATDLAYQSGIRIKRAQNIEAEGLPALVEEVHNDLESIKRSLFTRTLSNKILLDRVSKLDISLENLLAAISKINYK
jgi:hypothetical protein